MTLSVDPANQANDVAVEELDPTPAFMTAFEHFADWPHPLALDSADQQDARGRYSYICADPVEWIRYSVTDAMCRNPFAELRDRLAHFSLPQRADLPPFQGGVAGLFGYNLCHGIERIPFPHIDDFPTPALAVGVYDWVIAWDHVENRAWIISTGYPERHPQTRRERALDRLRQVRERLRTEIVPEYRPIRERITPQSAQYPLPRRVTVSSAFTRDGYLRAVARAVEYVHAGDCFQVNLSQRLLAPLPCSPLELYQRSRQRNPAPFAGYFDLGDVQIISSSPERFLQVQNGWVETRPIKGTRPRGRTPEESAAYIHDLQNSPKDRAENVMIVDLLRNDLGRVCRFGTVQVPTVCSVETYRHVHHLISVVRGKLRPDADALDLLQAAFPGGSVTGAPKVRAMEIIAELEPTARGPYCGSLGYVGFNGAMDTNILIRTFLVSGGWVSFPVGGGIVADSDPQAEYEETLHKAEGLLRSLE